MWQRPIPESNGGPTSIFNVIRRYNRSRPRNVETRWTRWMMLERRWDERCEIDERMDRWDKYRITDTESKTRRVWLDGYRPEDGKKESEERRGCRMSDVGCRVQASDPNSDPDADRTSTPELGRPHSARAEPGRVRVRIRRKRMELLMREIGKRRLGARRGGRGEQLAVVVLEVGGEGVREGEAGDGVGGADAGEEERVFGFVRLRVGVRAGAGNDEGEGGEVKGEAKGEGEGASRTDGSGVSGACTGGGGVRNVQVGQRATVCLDRRPGGRHAAAHRRRRGGRGCDGAKAVRGVKEDVCGRQGVVRNEDVGLRPCQWLERCCRRPDVLPVPQPPALTTTDIDLRPPLLHLIRDEALQLAPAPHASPSPRAATSFPAASRGTPPPTARPRARCAAHTSQDPEINHLLVHEGVRAV
ncbi:hypothetical protein B0H14DRAFT_2648973 [Mycena olivaceomarginata]|nr:hypothetical protein B0H14DRAFT_2648973 [Mycena olivaceomarginata]